MEAFRCDSMWQSLTELSGSLAVGRPLCGPGPAIWGSLDRPSTVLQSHLLLGGMRSLGGTKSKGKSKEKWPKQPPSVSPKVGSWPSWGRLQHRTRGSSGRSAYVTHTCKTQPKDSLHPGLTFSKPRLWEWSTQALGPSQVDRSHD